MLSSASDTPSMSSMSGTAIPPSSLVVARIPAGSSIPVPIRMSARQKAWIIGLLSSDPGDIWPEASHTPIVRWPTWISVEKATAKIRPSSPKTK